MRHPSGQQGIAHIAVIILITAVLGLIGLIGYIVVSNSGGETTGNVTVGPKTAATADDAEKADCSKAKDEDLCKFFAAYAETKNFRLTGSESTGSTVTLEVDGDNTRIKDQSGDTGVEIVTYNKKTYIKDGDRWLLSTAVDTAQTASFLDSFRQDLAEENQDNYTKLGKEACGARQCFKYESSQTDNGSTSTVTLWFDDKDYLLRRIVTDVDGNKTDGNLEYDNIKIEKPSPIAETGNSQ